MIKKKKNIIIIITEQQWQRVKSNTISLDILLHCFSFLRFINEKFSLFEFWNV